MFWKIYYHSFPGVFKESIIMYIHTFRGSIPVGTRDFSLYQHAHTGSGRRPQAPIHRVLEFFPGDSGRGVKLTNHLHLMPRLRMSGAIPLLVLYAFKACAEKTLPFLPVILSSKGKVVPVE
jgi:hypothetical protein